MRKKIRTKSFWMSLAAGVVLILNILGVKIDVPYVNEVLEAVCAVLVLLGVFTAPSPTAESKDSVASESPLLKPMQDEISAKPLEEETRIHTEK